MSDQIVQFFLYVSYVLVLVAVLGAVVLPIVIALTQNPKSLLKVLAGVAVLAVVFGISYGLSGNEVTAKYTEAGITEVSSQVVGGALTMIYLLLGIALVGVVVTEITKLIK